MRKEAIIGGLGYAVIFITGIFANFFVLEELKVVGDEAATFQNFANNPSRVVLALIAFIFMVIFDAVLTWVLYRMFKERHPKLSVVTALFRMINVVFFGAALLHFNTILSVISTPISNNGAAQHLSAALEGFNDIWLIGLVFFGVHLMLLSVLICRSERLGKTIPGLLMIAGIGYLMDTALQFGYDYYASIAEVSTMVVVLPGLIGELSLTGWLLFKAGKSKNKRPKFAK